MAININHPSNTIEGLDILNLNSGNSSNIELNPDSGLVNVNGNINITGNFTVNGTTTTINSTTSTVVDPIILLGTDVDGNPVTIIDSKDRGVGFYYNDGAGNKTGFFGYDRGTGTFRFVPDASISNEVVSGNDGTIKIDTVVVNTITSDMSGDIVLDPGSADIDASNSVIKNLLDPANAQDAATKNYVDGAINSNTNLSVDADTGTGVINLATDTLSINGTTYQVETSVTGNVITITLPTNMIVPGSLTVTTDLTVSGNTTVTGTVYAGQTTVSSLTISDLTSGRVPFASTSGQLVDSSDLIWNGVSLNVNGNVQGRYIDVVNGVNLNYATTNSLVFVNNSGALVTDGNLDWDGTTLAITGDQTISGDLIVNGQIDIDNITISNNVVESNLSGDIVLDANGDNVDVSASRIVNLADPTNAQDAATKNYVDTTINSNSNLTINGDTGTGVVNLASESLTVNGTADQITSTVSGETVTVSLPSAVVMPGTLDVTNDLTVNGNTQIDGNLNVDGNITLGGNITIGDQQIDTVNVVADFTSNLIPKTTLTYDLGSATNQWNNIYVGSVTTSGITSGNVNISGNTISAVDTNGDLNLVSNGTGGVNINGKKVGTDTDALMYAIVFGG